MGRLYEIFREGNIIIVKFNKLTNFNEDGIDGKDEFSMFVAIKAEPEEFNINNYWIEKEYSLDSDRN